MKTITNSLSRRNNNHLMIIGVCLLSGCSALSVNYDNKNDICYTSRNELRQSEHYYSKSIVEGAVVGGLLGAGAGALGAFIGGGNVSTAALIGGGVGVVAGGVGGYYLAKQKDIADEQALVASVKSDILVENGEIDRTAVAFARLRDCRFSNAERIKSDYKAGRLPRDKAINQLNELKLQFDQDIQMAQELGLKMNTRLTEFQDANNRILDNDPNARSILNAEKLSKVETPNIVSGFEGKKAPTGVVKNAKKKSKKKTNTDQITTDSTQKNKVTTIPAAQPLAPVSSPAVEVAHITETNQIKQKAFVDQIDKAKAQAKVAFTLEGSVSQATPEILVCGL